jgi:hypothetical protein
MVGLFCHNSLLFTSYRNSGALAATRQHSDPQALAAAGTRARRHSYVKQTFASANIYTLERQVNRDKRERLTLYIEE